MPCFFKKVKMYKMKNVYFFLILFLVSVSLHAQFKPTFYMNISQNKNILVSTQVNHGGSLSESSRNNPSTPVV